MHEIKTYVTVDTTLTNDNNSITNWDDYADYLNDTIYALLKDYDKSIKFVSERFGDLDITIYIDNSFRDNDGKFDVYVRIKTDDKNFNEDDWYDNIETDHSFIMFLTTEIKNFIEEINKTLRQIQHPINESLIFHDSKLYMEISPICNNHVPEYVHFAVDTDVNTDDIVENICVY